MLQLKSQSVKTKEEPCIGLTQENLIEFLVQMCLPYIPWDCSLYASTSNCYELRLKYKSTTLVLNNTKELNGVLVTN